MIHTELKNHKIHATDEMIDCLQHDNQFIRAYWNLMDVLKKYNAQQINLSFKGKVIKKSEPPVLDTRPKPMQGHKNKWRKGSRGSKPDMSDTEHFKIETEAVQP